MRAVLSFIAIFSFIFESDGSCDNVLVSDFDQSDCIAKQTDEETFYYSVDKSTCIPTCLPYKPEGYFKESCPCPPGYVCGKRCSGTIEDAEFTCETKQECVAKTGSIRANCIDMCVNNTASCMAYHANTVDYLTTTFTAQKFKPDCDIAGNWKPKQCKGGKSGRCFCFDAMGKRLFGQASYDKSQDMTCACSRKRADLEAAGRYFVSFHCDSMGNYEPLQCDSGLCWCVKPKTGQLTSPVVPEKAMPKLACYSASKVGSQYLRQCDSAQYGLATVLNTLKLHGVRYANLGMKLCDGDGAFGAYTIENGKAYCTWRDGKKIGSYATDSNTNLNDLNCNCARDTQMNATVLTCNGFGNYVPSQGVAVDGRNKYFCVDDDGFQKTDFSWEMIENCTLFY
ncbi:uncharacterized protein [Leptinotarsa decemlineata]|uniref:uncharacterized protein n=1 Tax=Leptinotarsa decemlineata TaxID=7539 RepID=UPI003D307E58